MLWNVIKSSINLSALRFSMFAFCLVLGFIYITVGSTKERNQGSLLGASFGKLHATSTLLDQQINKALEKKDEALPDVSAYETIIEQVRSESVVRNQKAKIVALIDPVKDAIDRYDIEAKANETEKAKQILFMQVAPANKTLLNALVDVHAKLVSSDSGLLPIVKVLFLCSGAIALILLPSTLGSHRFDYAKYLTGNLKRPLMMVTAGNYVESLKEEDNKLKESIRQLILLNIYTPDFDDLKPDKKSIFDLKVDVSDEITSAEAYATLLSNGQSTFNNLPSGVVNFQGQNSVLAYALIGWMSELATEHKAKRFDLKTDWNGSLWTVTLSTVEGNIHETLAPAYQQVLTKSGLISEKNHNSMDYVRTVLRLVTKGYRVEHASGELHLVLTFETGSK